MAIALKRAELNRALAHKTSYNTEGHNLCLALVHYNDGTSDVLAAYSNDSAVPESMRLGLGLIPNLYGELAEGKHFGCGGMAQFHTEPKLLNWLCATSIIRRGKYHQEHLPRIPFYRAILNKQRTEAAHHASRLKRPENMAAVTLVTEIDCCTTCTKYAIDRFRARFPHVALHVIELGKQSGEQTEYTRVSKTTKSPPS